MELKVFYICFKVMEGKLEKKKKNEWKMEDIYDFLSGKKYLVLMVFLWRFMWCCFFFVF